MKNQQGFIQIPILIAIIAGVLVLGVGGYFGVKQYQSYQAKQTEQQKELGEAKKEIENLKNKKSQPVKVFVTKTPSSAPIISSVPQTTLVSVIKEWRPGVVLITCRFS